MFFWSYRKKTIIILLKPFFIGPQSTIIYKLTSDLAGPAKPIWTLRSQSSSYPPMLFLQYQNIVSVSDSPECQMACTLVPMYKENGGMLVYVVLFVKPTFRVQKPWLFLTCSLATNSFLAAHHFCGLLQKMQLTKFVRTSCVWRQKSAWRWIVFATLHKSCSYSQTYSVQILQIKERVKSLVEMGGWCEE